MSTLIPASQGKAAIGNSPEKENNRELVAELRREVEEQRKVIEANNATIAALESDIALKVKVIAEQAEQIKALNGQNASLENKLELLNTTEVENKPAPETMPAEPEGKTVRKGRKERKA